MRLREAMIEALRKAGARDRRQRLPRSLFAVPQLRQHRDPETGLRRRLSRVQREVNAVHAHQCGPGERADARPKMEYLSQGSLLPAQGHQPREGRPGPHPRRATPIGKSCAPPETCSGLSQNKPASVTLSLRGTLVGPGLGGMVR